MRYQEQSYFSLDQRSSTVSFGRLRSLVKSFSFDSENQYQVEIHLQHGTLNLHFALIPRKEVMAAQHPVCDRPRALQIARLNILSPNSIWNCSQ